MILPESGEFPGLEHQIPVYPLYLKNAKTSIANLTYPSRTTMVRMRLYRIPESLGYITYRPLLGKWSGSPGQYSDIQTEPERIHGHHVPGYETGGCTHQMAQTLHMPFPNDWVPDATS
jgi:hypothetical protein